MPINIFNSERVCKIIAKHKTPFSEISELNILEILNKEYNNTSLNLSKLDTNNDISANKYDLPTQEVTPISYNKMHKLDLDLTLSDLSHNKHSEIEIEEFKFNDINLVNNTKNNMEFNDKVYKNNNLNFQFDFDDNFSYSNEDFLASKDNFDLKWFDVQCENGY